MWDTHIIVITFSIVLNWTIILSGSNSLEKDFGFNVSKQDRLKCDATFNRLLHGSTLLCSLISHLQNNCLIPQWALFGIGVNQICICRFTMYYGKCKSSQSLSWYSITYTCLLQLCYILFYNIWYAQVKIIKHLLTCLLFMVQIVIKM